MFTDTINIYFSTCKNLLIKTYSLVLNVIYTQQFNVDTGFVPNHYDFTYNIGKISLYSIKNLKNITVDVYGAFDEGSGAYFNGYYQYLVSSNWHYEQGRYCGKITINDSIIDKLKIDNINEINIIGRVYDDNPYGAGGGARGYMIFTITEESH